MTRRRILSYDSQLKQLSRKLRKHGTLGEVILWSRLQNKQIHGFAFYRQRPVDAYIVDFYCPDLMLAIEIDGATHDLRAEADLVRQERLESLGIRVLRFTEAAIRFDLERVLFEVKDAVEQIALERKP